MKLKSLSKVTPILRTVSDDVILRLIMGIGKKRISFLGCLGVLIIIKYVLSPLSLGHSIAKIVPMCR